MLGHCCNLGTDDFTPRNMHFTNTNSGCHNFESHGSAPLKMKQVSALEYIMFRAQNIPLSPSGIRKDLYSHRSVEHIWSYLQQVPQIRTKQFGCYSRCGDGCW
jgi:hypothetical protein